jgi:hypothetical protein
MADTQQKTQITTQKNYETIVIDAVLENHVTRGTGAKRICWNTGEEKNCPSCYLSKGCKAK